MNDKPKLTAELQQLAERFSKLDVPRWPQPSIEQRERLERLGYKVAMNAIGQPIAAPPDHSEDFNCAWFELDFVNVVGDENAAVIDTLARLSGIRAAKLFKDDLQKKFADKLHEARWERYGKRRQNELREARRADQERNR